MRTLLFSLLALTAFVAIVPLLPAQDDPPTKLTPEDVEVSVRRLDKFAQTATKEKIETDRFLGIAVYVAMGAAGGLLLLTAVFCSVWAQDHGRSGLLWFLLGLLLNVLALFLVLLLNPNKKNYSPGS